MIRFTAPAAGNVSFTFHLSASRALSALAGERPQTCGD
jgi:hypothetical protein